MVKRRKYRTKAGIDIVGDIDARPSDVENERLNVLESVEWHRCAWYVEVDRDCEDFRER